MVNSFWIPPDNGEFPHDSFLPRRLSAISASRSDTNSKAMEMPSINRPRSGLQQRNATNSVCSICADGSDFAAKHDIVERATATAVVPPTMVKNMTLERHAPEGDAIPSSLHAYNSPQHHCVPARQSLFLVVWQGECLTQPRYPVVWNSMNTFRVRRILVNPRHLQ